MSLYVNSRHLKTDTTQIETADNEFLDVYDLMQTTVDLENLPDETEWYVVKNGETFEDIAYNIYTHSGGTDLWWVLAMCNPHIFYPLDLAAGDKIRIPPTYWIEQFVKEADDWEVVWQRLLRY